MTNIVHTKRMKSFYNDEQEKYRIILLFEKQYKNSFRGGVMCGQDFISLSLQKKEEMISSLIELIFADETFIRGFLHILTKVEHFALQNQHKSLLLIFG